MRRWWLAVLVACGGDKPGTGDSAPSETDADTDADTDTDTDTDTGRTPHSGHTADSGTSHSGSGSGGLDGDSDGFAAPADCDDTDASVHPGAVELVGDGVDQDCDGTEICAIDADNDGPRAAVGTVQSLDLDCNDAGEALANENIDCNDTDASISPLQPETTGDEIDENCDGVELCWPDADQDGDRAAVGTVVSADADCADAGEASSVHPIDCDDADAVRNSRAVEIPGNNVDETCDLVEDCYVDSDDDGAHTFVVDLGGANNDADCNDANEGTSSDPIDCDDVDASIHPGAYEIRGDGVDQDCDGLSP